jgi:GT2 family glycosyltransferase
VTTGPVFSVIVPTFYRPIHLARCLDALLALDYPADAYEIVIVDDASSEQTVRQVEHSAEGRTTTLRYMAHQRGGPAKARNAGARVATGRYLAFTDDDCEPSRGWLRQLEAPLLLRDDVIVGGLTRNALPDRICSRASQLLIDYLYQYYDLAQTGSRFFTTNNLACSSTAFRKVGGFNESFPLAAGEDREFCERFQRLGGAAVFAPDAEVFHWHDLNLRRFARQHFNYGRGADFLHRSRWADLASTQGTMPGTQRRPKLEPPSFYFNLVRYPLARERGVAGWRLASLLSVSQAAYAAGYAYQRVRRAMQRS